MIEASINSCGNGGRWADMADGADKDRSNGMMIRKRASGTRKATLRRLRLSLGMSQEELAAEIGYSTRQIARWESGVGDVRHTILRHLEHLQPKPPTPDACDFTFVELFAGIGGFRKGFEGAGGRCVFAAERDAYARTTYSANFGTEGLHGDIRKVRAEDVPEHDILLASFPGESFSRTGDRGKAAPRRKRAATDETSGTAFHEIERVLQARRPKAFLLEAPADLAEHDEGRTFSIIRRVLEKTLGYTLSVRTIDARAWLPLHRERTYIVGMRRNAKAAFHWKSVDIPDLHWAPRLISVQHSGGDDDREARFTNRQGFALAKYTLSTRLWKYLRRELAKREAASGEACGPMSFDEVARTFTPRYYKDGSEILLQRERGNPRRLTPRECSRLMGFDPANAAPFRIVVSDTQAYKQFGGAVAVPVAAAIARALAPKVVGAKPGKGTVRESPGYRLHARFDYGE